MKRRLVQRSAVGLALGALAAAGLAGVPTPAHAAVSNAYADNGVSFYDYESCTRVGAVNGPDEVAWSDNGIPVSQSYSTSGTFTDTVNTNDIVDVSASGSVTVSSTPFTGSITTTITGTASASASAVSRLASTECNSSARAEPGAWGNLVLTQPMWVTLTAKGDGNGYGSVGVEGPDGGAYISVYKRGTGSTSALLPAGPIGLGFSANADASSYDDHDGTRAYSGSFKIELQPVGAASAATGKGGAYTQFGARNCSTGAVDAAITKKAKKKAKQILVKVNGKKVANLKGKKLKKRTLVLPAAPATAAEVVATITLKNGKKVTVTRSYLACS